MGVKAYTVDMHVNIVHLILGEITGLEYTIKCNCLSHRTIQCYVEVYNREIKKSVGKPSYEEAHKCLAEAGGDVMKAVDSCYEKRKKKVIKGPEIVGYVISYSVVYIHTYIHTYIHIYIHMSGL